MVKLAPTTQKKLPQKNVLFMSLRRGWRFWGWHLPDPHPPTTPKTKLLCDWSRMRAALSNAINMLMRWWTSPSLGQRRKASWTVCQSFSKPRQGFDRQSRDFESQDCNRTEFFLLVQEFGNFKFNSPGLREGHPHSKVSFCVLLRHVWPLLLCSVPSASEASPEGCSQDKSG